MNQVGERWLAAAVSTVCVVAVAEAQIIPAFPGADGAARHVTGGRGGLVYHVTKLDRNYSDNGPGTLRYGLTDSNFPAGTRRTIVFDVAGTFWLGRYGAERGHDNGWDTQSRLNWGSNVTIAGQTAPGPVYIMGGVTKANGVNTIIRNVTIAPGYGMRNFSKPEDGIFPTPGDFPDSYVYDAIDISGQGIMIDHVSTLYATDEAISCNEQTQNLTVQYSNISQGQNYPQADAEASGVRYTGHAMGSLLEAGSSTAKAAVSFHHNLYAHQKSRVPQTQGGGQGGYYDFRNNVFYNWLGSAGSRSGTTYWNLVGNFYLAGPGGDNPVGGTSTGITTASGGTSVIGTSSNIFRSGNLLDSNKDGDANDGNPLSNAGAANPIWMDGPTYGGVTDSATVAFDRVLDYMGATWWSRTPMDQRIINEVRTGTGKIMAWADDPFNNDPNEGVEWRQMLSYRADPVTGDAPFTRPANWDTDADGMPDEWEVKYGLDPLVANPSGDFDNDGYTDLEEYINDLAAWPAPTAIGFNAAVNGRYADIRNWDSNPDPTLTLPWQPSRFDTAQINAGTVTVDAVGQDAFYVQVGATATPNATLAVTDGWLHVRSDLEIGTAAASAGATLSLSGGKLVVAGAIRGGLGSANEFELIGGTLVANQVDLTRLGGTLVNAGATISPGDSGVAGRTTVIGSVELASGGTLQIDLAGSTAATAFQSVGAFFDQLAVSSVAQLGGTLELDLIDGYSPTLMQSHRIIAGSVIGRFDSIVGVEISDALSLAVTVDAGGVLVTAATPGDANLSGDVDFQDLLRLARNFDQTGVDWAGGDFNGDGAANFVDLLTLARNYGQPSFESDWLLASSLVPEPASFVALTMIGVISLRRRG